MVAFLLHFCQFAVLAMPTLFERYMHTRRKDAERPKAVVCTWPSVSHCSEETIQVTLVMPMYLLELVTDVVSSLPMFIRLGYKSPSAPLSENFMLFLLRV